MGFGEIPSNLRDLHRDLHREKRKGNKVSESIQHAPLVASERMGKAIHLSHMSILQIEALTRLTCLTHRMSRKQDARTFRRVSQLWKLMPCRIENIDLLPSSMACAFSGYTLDIPSMFGSSFQVFMICSSVFVTATHSDTYIPVILKSIH